MIQYMISITKLPFITSSNNFQTIVFPQVSLCLNDTTFQCLLSQLMGYNRRYTLMIVQPLSGNALCMKLASSKDKYCQDSEIKFFHVFL